MTTRLSKIQTVNVGLQKGYEATLQLMGFEYASVQVMADVKDEPPNTYVVFIRGAPPTVRQTLIELNPIKGSSIVFKFMKGGKVL